MRVYALLVSAIITIAIMGVGYWVATGFVPPQTETPKWLGQHPIAHRGLFSEDAERPENSLAAFRAAADAGYGIELDVQSAADGTVIVLHDYDLERLTGRKGLASESTYSQIRELRLLDGREHIPTLTEALAVVGGRVPLLIEIKNEGEVGALEDAVARAVLDYQGEVAVMSFNPYSLAQVAKSAPEVPRGQLSGTFDGEDLAWYKKAILRPMLMNWTSKPHFIAYDLSALPSWHTSLQRSRGRPIVAWTAQSSEDYARAQLIADGVLFDPAAMP